MRLRKLPMILIDQNGGRYFASDEQMKQRSMQIPLRQLISCTAWFLCLLLVVFVAMLRFAGGPCSYAPSWLLNRTAAVVDAHTDALATATAQLERMNFNYEQLHTSYDDLCIVMVSGVERRQQYALRALASLLRGIDNNTTDRPPHLLIVTANDANESNSLLISHAKRLGIAVRALPPPLATAASLSPTERLELAALSIVDSLDTDEKKMARIRMLEVGRNHVFAMKECRLMLEEEAAVRRRNGNGDGNVDDGNDYSAAIVVLEDDVIARPNYLESIHSIRQLQRIRSFKSSGGAYVLLYWVSYHDWELEYHVPLFVGAFVATAAIAFAIAQSSRLQRTIFFRSQPLGARAPRWHAAAVATVTATTALLLLFLLSRHHTLAPLQHYVSGINRRPMPSIDSNGNVTLLPHEYVKTATAVLYTSLSSVESFTNYFEAQERRFLPHDIFLWEWSQLHDEHRGFYVHPNLFNHIGLVSSRGDNYYMLCGQYDFYFDNKY